MNWQKLELQVVKKQTKFSDYTKWVSSRSDTVSYICTSFLLSNFHLQENDYLRVELKYLKISSKLIIQTGKTPRKVGCGILATSHPKLELLQIMKFLFTINNSKFN